MRPDSFWQQSLAADHWKMVCRKRIHKLHVTYWDFASVWEVSTAGKYWEINWALRLPPPPPSATAGLRFIGLEGRCHFGSRGEDSPVLLLSWEMSDEWKNLEKALNDDHGGRGIDIAQKKEISKLTQRVLLTSEKSEEPFATDKSKVDSDEEESWRHPQHQTDGDVRPIEEYKWRRVCLFSVLK